MKGLLWFVISLLAIVLVAHAEWNTPTTAQAYTDQVTVASPDTITFTLSDAADILFVQIVTTNVATLTMKYRCFQRADDIHLANASYDDVTFRKADSTPTTSLTTAADGCYTIELDPRGGIYQQFILITTADLDFTLICKQRTH